MNRTKKLKREIRKLETKAIRNALRVVILAAHDYLKTQNEKPGVDSELDALRDYNTARKERRDLKDKRDDTLRYLQLRRMTPEARFYASIGSP